MKNQVLLGTPTSPRFAKCPITVRGDDAVLLGSEPAVALTDYQAAEGGATFYTDGTFVLTVVGSSTHSPFTGHTIKPGDPLFAVGTLDATTNVTTGLTITAATGDTPFGRLDPQYQTNVGSGLTDAAAWVKI